MENENFNNPTTIEETAVNKNENTRESQADRGIYKKKYLSENWRFFLSGIEFSLEEIVEPFLQDVEKLLKDDPDQEFKNEFVLLKNLVCDRIDTARGDVLIKLIDDQVENMTKEEKENLSQVAAEEGEYEVGMRPAWNSELFEENTEIDH